MKYQIVNKLNDVFVFETAAASKSFLKMEQASRALIHSPFDSFDGYAIMIIHCYISVISHNSSIWLPFKLTDAWMGDPAIDHVSKKGTRSKDGGIISWAGEQHRRIACSTKTTVIPMSIRESNVRPHRCCWNQRTLVSECDLKKAAKGYPAAEIFELNCRIWTRILGIHCHKGARKTIKEMDASESNYNYLCRRWTGLTIRNPLCVVLPREKQL